MAGPIVGRAELRFVPDGRNFPSANPTMIAAIPTPIGRIGLWPLDPLATAPVRTTLGPVVAVSVSAFSHATFQMAVFRSRVKSAPGAEVIWFGTVNEKVTVKMDASSSLVSGDAWDPGDGDANAAGWVVNV
jgi:hypothetical protein